MVEDFNLNQGKPVVMDDIEFLKQEIDILFDTNKNDLFGDINYGTNYETCLFELEFDADSMANKIVDDLYGLDLRGFTPTATCYLLDGTERDIMVIDVNLKRGYENYEKIYKIE